MASSSKVNFTLLASEWGSKRGGLSTFNRVLAIELAKHSKVHVSVLVPRCDQDEIDDAENKDVALIRAEEKPGIDEMLWLSFPPEDLQIDVVIGHGVVLGRQAQIIRRNLRCKWIQFVHTDPEELGMFKDYLNPIAKSEQKHKTEVALCAMADFVVAVGPKLAEAYRSYLRSHDKDQRVFDLTPGIFDEFSSVVQATEDRAMCRVLVFGRGDAEDFSLKGFDIAAEAVGGLPNTILYVVGAPNEKQDEVADKLKQHIPRERLRVRRFIENREELRNLFREVDVAIMPSRTEGFGLAALEALSAGLPILVGGNSGFGEVLAEVPGGSYCVIQSEKPTVWSEEIKKVLAKKREIRLKEADLLRTYYEEKYSWEKQCKDLVEHVGGIAAGMNKGKTVFNNDVPSYCDSCYVSTSIQMSFVSYTLLFVRSLRQLYKHELS